MKSTASMHRAALESAAIFNQVVAGCARNAGLLRVLELGGTVDDVVAQMAFNPERRQQVEYMLEVLEHERLLSRRHWGGRIVYRTQAAQPPANVANTASVCTSDVQHWFGDSHVQMIYRANQRFLGHDLEFLRSRSGAISFGRKFEAEWRTNLTNPLYEFGRLRCVAALAETGHRFLDLACGMGLGTERLAEHARGSAEILAVDKSADFLALAARGNYLSARPRFVQIDLNRRFPPCRSGSIDGVLFNGAFHFVEDKAAMLRNISRALRVGGRLALGHCFSIGCRSHIDAASAAISQGSLPLAPQASPVPSSALRRVS